MVDLVACSGEVTDCNQMKCMYVSQSPTVFFWGGNFEECSALHLSRLLYRAFGKTMTKSYTDKKYRALILYVLELLFCMDIGD